jgi:hypothetical protein
VRNTTARHGSKTEKAIRQYGHGHVNVEAGSQQQRQQREHFDKKILGENQQRKIKYIGVAHRLDMEYMVHVVASAIWGNTGHILSMEFPSPTGTITE